MYVQCFDKISVVSLHIHVQSHDYCWRMWCWWVRDDSQLRADLSWVPQFLLFTQSAPTLQKWSIIRCALCHLSCAWFHQQNFAAGSPRCYPTGDPMVTCNAMEQNPTGRQENPDNVSHLRNKGCSIHSSPTRIINLQNLVIMSRNARTWSQLLSVYYSFTLFHMRVLLSMGIKILTTKQGQKSKMCQFSNE